METKHDEIRRILDQHGFKFKDSDRTALDMTDEEVEKFLVEFVARFTELASSLSEAFNQLIAVVVQAAKPMRDLNLMLSQPPEEANHG